MTDLTPPPMSKQEVDLLSDNVLKAAGSALRHYTMQKSLGRIEVAMRSALAARDEQWRQRLELVGIVGPDRTWFPPVAVVEGGTPLYRIKEQARAALDAAREAKG